MRPIDTPPIYIIIHKYGGVYIRKYIILGRVGKYCLCTALQTEHVQVYSCGKRGKDHTVTVRAFLDLELSSYVVSLQ
jgi:hypothetical protein